MDSSDEQKSSQKSCLELTSIQRFIGQEWGRQVAAEIGSNGPKNSRRSRRGPCQYVPLQTVWKLTARKTMVASHRNRTTFDRASERHQPGNERWCSCVAAQALLDGSLVGTPMSWAKWRLGQNEKEAQGLYLRSTTTQWGDRVTSEPKKWENDPTEV